MQGSCCPGLLGSAVCVVHMASWSAHSSAWVHGTPENPAVRTVPTTHCCLVCGPDAKTHSAVTFMIFWPLHLGPACVHHVMCPRHTTATSLVLLALPWSRHHGRGRRSALTAFSDSCGFMTQPQAKNTPNLYGHCWSRHRGLSAVPRDFLTPDLITRV